MVEALVFLLPPELTRDYVREEWLRALDEETEIVGGPGLAIILVGDGRGEKLVVAGGFWANVVYSPNIDSMYIEPLIFLPHYREVEEVTSVKYDGDTRQLDEIIPDYRVRVYPSICAGAGRLERECTSLATLMSEIEGEIMAKAGEYGELKIVGIALPRLIGRSTEA